MSVNFQPIYPKSDLLKDFVYCFYTVESNDADFKSIHYSFPHTYNAVTFYQGVNVELTDDKVSISGNGSEEITCILQGKRQRPLLVNLAGPFKRVTILFKPLGLNQFIDHPLSDHMSSNIQLFDAWDLPGDIFSSQHSNQVERVELLLCRYFRPFDQPALQKALMLLQNFDKEFSMEEVALLIGMSLRTFNRLFRTHLGISPVAYRRIARFRHSLENKLFHDQFSTLTEIGYQSNFYDQSYFIKLYNQLSGSNPGSLFNKVKQLGDSKLVFEFIKSVG